MIDMNDKRIYQHRLLILAVKYVPVLSAICYIINTIAAWFGYIIEPLSNIAGMSLLVWVYTYLCSKVFGFCIYHRLCLWYILADDIINIIDYYWGIPVATEDVLMIHNVLIGVLIILMLLNHVRSYKDTSLKDNRRH